MSLNCVFDVETAPLDEKTVLARVGEFDPVAFRAAKYPAPFDPASVKCGNLKAENAEKKIEEARAAHEKACKDFDSNLSMAAAEHSLDAMGKAALSAITGRVVAIGIAGRSSEFLHFIDEYAKHSAESDDSAEHRMIEKFWGTYQACHESGHKLIGVNIFKFDLPFLCQRSMLLGVEIPATVQERGRYWSPTFVDLVERFCCGNPNGYVSFDLLCKAFDLPGKPEIEVGDETIEGKNFWKFSRSGDPVMREAARQYLLNDIIQPRELARRMNIF